MEVFGYGIDGATGRAGSLPPHPTLLAVAVASQHSVPDSPQVWKKQNEGPQDEMDMELTRKELEAHDRLLENNLKISLLVEINEVLQQRQEVVQRHNLLLKNISDLQNQVQETYKWIESLWDEKIAGEKKRGNQLEGEVNGLRAQIAALQGAPGAAGTPTTPGSTHPPKLPELSPQDGSKSTGKDMPSRKANYKITASRLQGEIKGLQQRINTTKLRLLNEIKNKQQAESDVRLLRQHMSASRHGSKASSTVTTPLPGPALCYFGDQRQSFKGSRMA